MQKLSSELLWQRQLISLSQAECANLFDDDTIKHQQLMVSCVTFAVITLEQCCSHVIQIISRLMMPTLSVYCVMMMENGKLNKA